MSVIYGSLIKRSLATILDVSVGLLIQMFGSFFGAYTAAFFAGLEALEAGSFLGFWYFGISYWTINLVFAQGLWGQSLGKYFLGIKVVDSDGQPLGIPKSLYRAIMLSSNISLFGIGFLSAYFEKQKRSWHDLLAHSLVIEKSDPKNVQPIILAQKTDFPIQANNSQNSSQAA